MISSERLLEITSYANKKGKDEACRIFDISESTLERYMRGIKDIPAETHGQTELSDEQSDNSRILTARSANITSLDDLLSYSKVDLSKWKVSRHVVNAWEVTAGEGKTYTNYQVKAWLEARKQESVEDLLKTFRDQAFNYSPDYPVFERDEKNNDACMLEISIPDFHLGQLSWASETGRENYDVKIAQKLFIDAVVYLLEHSKPFNIERVLFPIGNDYFNVNSALNTTFAGTPQDEDCRWQKSFTYGREMAVEAIDRIAAIADVDVLIVPGNHDYEKSFYLGEVLGAWYRKTDQVNVNNSPIMRKYYSYGNTLIGLTHGNKLKLENLPLIMATDCPQEWAAAKYREYHIGHFHRKNEIEVRQVMVSTLPSLVPVSAWAANSGYDHLREAVGNVYDKKRGKVASIHYRPED